MDTRHVGHWAWAGATVALLAACGGGEVLAVLGFVGAGGGDFYVDGEVGVAGLQFDDTCSNPPNCAINLQLDDPGAGAWTDNYYTAALALRYTNSAGVPWCAASGSGRVDGERLELNSCFSGRYVTVNEAVSDDGSKRLFFEFTPRLSEGVWVEIQDRRRRFKFGDYDANDAAAGCELTSPAKTPATAVVSRAQFFNGEPFESTVTSFSIDGGGAYSGRFIGVSGLRLTRGSDMLELQRERDTTTDCL
jgi:hypothetical protein